MHLIQNSNSSKLLSKYKKPQMESAKKMICQSNKENTSYSFNANKENHKNLMNLNQDNSKLNNDILSVKHHSNSASINMDNLYSGDFGAKSKIESNSFFNTITVEPFKEFQNEQDKIKDLIDEDSVYAFERLHAPIKKTKIDNGSSVSMLKTPQRKSFFDLMKNMNFSTFNHSNTSMFVSKPKKKILTTEELLLDKINKEKEAFRIQKQKNEISVEKNKVFNPKSLMPTPLTTFQPFNITTNINMLKKKRINNNTEELNEKIKEQMKKKFGESNKFFKEKHFDENKTIDSDIEADIQDLTSGLETFTLSKNKNKDSFVNSPNNFKLPSKKSTLLSNTLYRDKSLKSLFKNEKTTNSINCVISKTREEKDQIDKENKEMLKKTAIIEKKYYYKGKTNFNQTKKTQNQ